MQTERLTTLDEFGNRQFVIPAEVRGRLRTWRNRVYFFLFGVFLLLPWIKINGLQAMLLDIPHRRFEIFGMLFLAHDTPLLFLILAICTLSLTLATALYGRIWCGWACPQTVFIDGVYRRIETWVEGSYIERRKLHAGPMSAAKLRKVSLKWLLYFLVSSIFAHSLIAYFTGSTHLLQMIQGSPQENWTYFVIVSAVTGLLLFNFGWFREQFCFIMCPYGRFQSVLMDPETVTVQYDEKRGEPRKGAAHAGHPAGDCVSCNRCVQVCPTGIDIRKGVQLECIACTACIDACDEIMTKVNKPLSLIGYRTMRGGKPKIARPRVIILASLIVLCTSILLLALARHTPYSAKILRASDTPYQLLPEEMVLNHFKVHFINQSQSEEEFSISLTASALANKVKLTQTAPAIKLNAGESRETHFFLIFPRTLLNEHGEVQIDLLISEGRETAPAVKQVTAVGPAQPTPKSQNPGQ